MSYTLERLGNHIEILSGYAYKSKDFIESGIPVIKIKNVTPPNVSLIDLSYVSEEVAYETSKFILRYDDVLIALTGSHINQMASVVGRVAKVKYHEKTVMNQRVGKITALQDCDLDYVYYYLSQDDVKISLASKAGGAANQANISPSDIKNLMIPFPNIDVQKRISSLLRSYDDLIDNNQKQIKLLEEAAQRLYKEWFVDLRFPGYEGVDIVDGMPKGWKKDNIGSLFKTVLGGTPSRDKADFWGGDIPWINSGEVNKLRIIKESEFITESGLNNSSTKLMPIHTTVLAITGATLGQVSYTEIETCANQSVVGVYDETGEYSAYIYLCISNEIKKIISEAIGGAQQHINKEVINKFEILLPDFEVNKRMKAIIVPMFDKITNLYFEMERLSEARDRLLPKLMSGEIEL